MFFKAFLALLFIIKNVSLIPNTDEILKLVKKKIHSLDSTLSTPRPGAVESLKVLPMRVGGATSQIDLPSLMPLSVAGCGRLQLGVPHWATSVYYCK